MKIVIPGGSGHLGQMMRAAFGARGHRVTVLGRGGGPDLVKWDGRTLGAWAHEIDGCDAVVNMAGRTVNCRYTAANLQEMMSSRIDSAKIVGEAIAAASKPPRVWLQSSTATIYKHTRGPANDEHHGEIGGGEPGVPRYWDFSVKIATEWERMLDEAVTPHTRKVAMRMAMVMGAEPGGTFDILFGVARWGFGGALAGGEQFMSWMHERDFVRAVEFLIEREDLEGAVNLASPHPLPQREFMAAVRDAAGLTIGLPVTSWMYEVGAFFLRSDTELLRKSRRAVPTRLLEAGFAFEFPSWPQAARDLVARVRARPA